MAVLAPVAREAARQFGLEVVGLELVLHGYGTTFRVETTTGRYALRVNTNSQSTPAEVPAPQTWQLAIAEETDLRDDRGQMRMFLAGRNSYRGRRPVVMKSVMNWAYRARGQLRLMTRSS